MLRACGHYLIVKLEPMDEEKVSAGGIVLAETISEKKRQQSGGQYAEVMDVGRNCWAGFTDNNGEWYEWCKKGSRIMLARYAGQAFPIDDSATKEEQAEAELLRLIKDDDVLVVEVNDE